MFKPIPYILVGKRREEIIDQFAAFNEELEKARRMQMALLRPTDIQLPDSLDVGVMLKQSRTVGGDLFMFSTYEHTFRFIITDVCGKGMTAALYMSAINHILRTIDNQNLPPAEFCNVLNREMCGLNIDGMFMTMITGIIDMKNGKVTYVNAGHMPPIYWPSAGNPDFFATNADVPIGVIEDYDYTETSEQLNKFDTVILYTDGILDSVNEFEECYGKERLINAVSKTISRTSTDIIATVSKDIRAFNKDIIQADDMVLMSFCYNGTEMFEQATVPLSESINEIPISDKEVLNEIQITF